MKKLTLLSIINILLIISCSVSPDSIIQLENSNNDLTKIWIQGKEHIEMPNGKIKYIISFDKIENGRISFDASIGNFSDEIKEINHLLFKINYSKFRGSDPGVSYFAIDPELEILEIRKDISRETKRYTRELGTKVIFSFFDVIEAFSGADDNKTDDELEQEEIDDMEQEIHDKEDKQWHIERMKELSEMRNRQEQFALRKTTLLPGYKVSGKIYFPYVPNCQQIRLSIDDGKNYIYYEIMEY